MAREKVARSCCARTTWISFTRLVSHWRFRFTWRQLLFHWRVGRNALLSRHVQCEALERLAEARRVDRAGRFIDESFLDHHLEHLREELLLQVVKLLVLVC